MEAALFAQLIVSVGLPLAKQIVAWQQEGKVVTPADFALVDKLADYRSNDSLAAFGIKIEGDKVVPI